jgi:cytoskeletal protein RodZ
MPAYILVRARTMQATTPFGDRLKRERELRGVTLEEVAGATRISPKFLEALENDRWDQLPGGAFNRGFVRSVARFLGLDEDSMVAEYALATHDTTDLSAWEKAPNTDRRRKALGVALIVCVLVVAVGGWLVFHRYSAAAANWFRSHSAAPLSAQEARPEPSAPANANPADEPATASAPKFLELKVDAGKAADVKVAADGKGVFAGHMPAGGSQTFRARDKLEISASDSSAVLLELNGQTVPPLGAPGQPGSATLTRADLKRLMGGRH